MYLLCDENATTDPSKSVIEYGGQTKHEDEGYIENIFTIVTPYACPTKQALGGLGYGGLMMVL